MEIKAILAYLAATKEIDHILGTRETERTTLTEKQHKHLNEREIIAREQREKALEIIKQTKALKNISELGEDADVGELGIDNDGNVCVCVIWESDDDFFDGKTWVEINTFQRAPANLSEILLKSYNK